MANIRIPTPLRQYAGGNTTIPVIGDTVAQALRDLVDKYPELESHLFENGKLRSFVNIYINQEDIRYLDGVDTEVTVDDKLMIVPSIAGG